MSGCTGCRDQRGKSRVSPVHHSASDVRLRRQTVEYRAEGPSADGTSRQIRRSQAHRMTRPKELTELCGSARQELQCAQRRSILPQCVAGSAVFDLLRRQGIRVWVCASAAPTPTPIVRVA